MTSDVKNVRLSNLDVRDGRHVGVLAQNTVNLQLENLIAHSHDTRNRCDQQHECDCSCVTNLRRRVYDYECHGGRCAKNARKETWKYLRTMSVTMRCGNAVIKSEYFGLVLETYFVVILCVRAVNGFRWG